MSSDSDSDIDSDDDTVSYISNSGDLPGGVAIHPNQANGMGFAQNANIFIIG